ncbi:MAG TPA: BatA domain-containing protein, partial [Dongiaceae bacterium]|nr:BatA domain-containing protein [Dongiaceae bacterium]
MLTLGSLTFAAPWLLAALAVLPILWWLLRLTPPSPRRIAFPPIRLLFLLRPKEETPHRTPWWLILLRLIIAALVIAGLAQPLWNANFGFPRNGPVMIVLDDGWAAAHGWEQRKEAAAALIERAERNGRPVILATTAPQASDSGFGLTPMPAANAATQLAAMEPSPWPSDRAAAAARFDKADLPRDLNIFWLSDGLASQKPETDTAFSDSLWNHGSLDVMSLKLDLPLMLLPPERDADGLWARVTRAQIGASQPVNLRAL